MSFPPTYRSSSAVVWVAIAALLLSAGGRLGAQDPLHAPKDDQASMGQVKNFVVPDYYDPPNQNQMKSLLRGAEAQPQPDGRVLIKDLQLETYNTNGRTMMVVRASDCTYTYGQGAETASSSNRIQATSGDGKLFVEGEGFRWEQTNSLFVISNKVHTTIRQEEPAAP